MTVARDYVYRARKGSFVRRCLETLGLGRRAPRNARVVDPARALDLTHPRILERMRRVEDERRARDVASRNAADRARILAASDGEPLPMFLRPQAD